LPNEITGVEFSTMSQPVVVLRRIMLDKYSGTGDIFISLTATA